MTSKVQLYLNTSEATKKLNGTYNTDLIFLFSSPVIPPPNYNMTLKLINMYIPISFTIINDNNNLFYLNGTEYTMTNGNYNASTLASHIQDLVSSYDPTFTLTFDTITNKYTITSSTYDFTINDESTCLYVLGFSGEVSSSSKSLTSTYPVDLTGDNIIFVDVRNISTPNLSSRTGSRTSIISSVLVDVPYGSVLYHEDTSNTAFVIQEDHISFVHIRLYGEDGETLIDMNNFDWSLTLEVGFIEKALQPTITNTYKDIYKNYLSSLMNKA